MHGILFTMYCIHIIIETKQVDEDGQKECEVSTKYILVYLECWILLDTLVRYSSVLINPGLWLKLLCIPRQSIGIIVPTQGQNNRQKVAHIGHWTLKVRLLCPTASRVASQAFGQRTTGLTDFIFPRSPFLFLSRVSNKHGNVLDLSLHCVMNVWFLQRKHTHTHLYTDQSSKPHKFIQKQGFGKSLLVFPILSVADLKGSWR